MTLLIIGFIAAVALVWIAAENETLEEYSERMHINRMADRSRARKAPGMRRACRYVQAGMRNAR